MRFWLVCFIGLFAIAELSQHISWPQEWLHQTLPMPIVWVGGIALALLSNYSSLHPRPISPAAPAPEPLAVPPDVASPIAANAEQPEVSPASPAPVPREQPRSISFEINAGIKPKG